MTDYLMIGEVLKPQGLRGECKIRPYAADRALFPLGYPVSPRRGEVSAPPLPGFPHS